MNKVLLALSTLALATALALGCGNSVDGGDTQTNWLKRCTSGVECGGLECVCGRCAKSCAATSDCSGTPVTSSCQLESSVGAQALCEERAPASVCLAACDSGASCAAGQHCAGGACVPDATSTADGGLPDGNVPDGGAGDGDATGFCARWLDEFAAFVESCGCGAPAAQAYREQNSSLCEPGGFFASLAGAVAAGDLRYDSAAAEALFARLHEADAECVEEPFRALRLDSLEVYSLGGVFTGTHALGSVCTLPVSYKGGVSDCAEGLCAADAAGGGMCIALASEGDPCDASGDDHLDSTTPRLCFEERAADADGEYESAFDSLSCAAPAAGGVKVCARDLADGQDCDSDITCASGRCASVGVQQGVCSPKAAAGEACSSSGDCSSGACRYDALPNVCGALLGDGLSCVYDDAACQSGSCNDPDGSGGFCGPPPSRAIGESCSASTDCISSGHGDSRDGVCHEGVCVADVCADYLP